MQMDREDWVSLNEGITCFNNEQYWECHEVLEDVWMEPNHDLHKYVCWVIIQISVSLFHVREKNLAGALSMLKKAKEKIGKAEKLMEDPSSLNQHLPWDQFKSMINHIESKQNLEAFSELKKVKLEVFS